MPRVVRAIGRGPLVTVDHLRHAATGLPQRVLVRTCERAATTWHDNFAAFAPQTIEWLAACCATLVGIDTPSVDRASSTALDSHHALCRLDLRVLENLVLDEMPEDDYELIALPLKRH